MNSYIEPNCSVRQQRQEQEGEEEDRERFSHVYNQPTVLPTPFFTELTLENGLPARHAISGLVGPIPERLTHAHDTLEFAVRQATHCKQKPGIGNYYHDLANLGYHRQPSSSLCQSAENSYKGPMCPSSTEDPMKPKPSPRQAQGSDDDEFQEHMNNMGTMPFRETDTTFVTWPPFNSPILPSSHVNKWAEKSRGGPMGSNHLKRPTKLRRSSQQRECSEDVCEEGRKRIATTSFEENDPSFSTWPWFEATASIKSKTMDDDSTSHGGLEKQVQKKMDSGGSHSTRRSRTAVVHNQSERRRRDRINEKMRALQKLVPGTSKADKASILDEVIKHLKQLQAQLMMMMMMMSRRGAPQLMIPPAVLQQQQQQQQQQQLLLQQQQLYMSLMARFGMGMGVLDMSSIRPPPPPPPPPQILNPIFHSTAIGSTPFTTTPPPFVPPDQMVMPTHTTSPLEKPSPTPNPPPQPDPFSAFLTQSMNIDFYNKMAILYKHQQSKSMRANLPSHEKHEQKK